MLDNDDVSFGYWWDFKPKNTFMKKTTSTFNSKEEEVYLAASTFMPLPFCNVSGGGKTFMIYKWVIYTTIIENH